MAPQLKNTLAVVALAPGASVALPHNLNDGDRPLAPDIIFLPTEDLSVSASDDTAVTVRNDSGIAFSGSILVEAWHSIERAFGGSGNVDLPVKPYIVVGAEPGNTPPQPPFTPGLVTIYARTTGSDLTGDGSLAAPYRTFQRAVRDVPDVLPAGIRYMIDITGITETLPQDYTLPAWVVPDTLSSIGSDSTSDPYLTVRMGVTIFAVPQPVAALPPADSIINFADIAFVQEIAAIGDAFTKVGNTMTLTDVSGPFGGVVIGMEVVITGANSPGNNGQFFVSAVPGPTQIQYTNAAGVAEAATAGVTAWSVLNTVLDPVTQLRTLTLNVPRALWAVTGTGDALAVTGTTAPVVTLTDATGNLFTASMVGKPITIAGATNPANNGTYKVASFISASQITYFNPNAVAEAVFPGTWQVGLITGKFTIDSANNTANAVIYQNTATTITITTNQFLTFPLQIAEPSAVLTGSSLRKGTLAALNIGSIGFVGIKVAPTTPGQQGLYIDTPGWASLLLCELDSPGAPPQAGALLPTRTDFNHACWIYGQTHLSSYRSVFFRNMFLDRCTDLGAGDPRNLFNFESCKSIFFTRTVFDACAALASVNHVFISTRERNAGTVEWWFANSILVRNCTNTLAAIFFSGNTGFFADVDIYGNAGSAILCSGGQGLLNAFNVRTRGGGANIGFGLDVRHGMRVLANPTTYTAAAGTELRGRDLVFPVVPGVWGFTLAGTNVTLTAVAGTFLSTMVGRRITIAGAPSIGNDGTFVIASVSVTGNQVTYANAAGATELADGDTTWTLEGGDLQVGYLPIRTWSNFNNVAPLRNSFDITAVAATGASGSGSQVIADPFIP